ncbi:amidohydrolase 2 [Russula earlei]|uniref:Amidohydrolase 2 n=1 Tax=Russula earlei TaxID=71964 RepID=A0ACC0TS47_9AGAM|nr:amidohydrolase 2 [Russula earlei]
MTPHDHPLDAESYIDILRDYPAIDNHAHPLLTEENRARLAFEGLASEAEGAALDDAVYTLPLAAARRDLVRLYGLPRHASWEDVKEHRSARAYDELCRLCFSKARTQCILIDDGLGGVNEMAEGFRWHDRYTASPTRRIVRVEVVAQVRNDLLVELFGAGGSPDARVLQTFSATLRALLEASAEDPSVAGFKSVVCYRTGLDVSAVPDPVAELLALRVSHESFRSRTSDGPLRLADKALNDLVVRVTLEVAAEHGIPVQFHTGLGDADITLTRASPAHLQPLIASNPRTTFVLLHGSYPYTREAGYLTAMYKNVYLDMGEVFPMLSGAGQESLIRQVLELTPTNKVMWSSDGHWWPESYYLGSFQARRALSSVLRDAVEADELTEDEAARVAKDILFHTANRVYRLGLEPQSLVPR